MCDTILNIHYNNAENVGSIDSCQSVICTDCVQVNEHTSKTSGLIIVFYTSCCQIVLETGLKFNCKQVHQKASILHKIPTYYTADNFIVTGKFLMISYSCRCRVGHPITAVSLKWHLHHKQCLLRGINTVTKKHQLMFNKVGWMDSIQSLTKRS